MNRILRTIYRSSRIILLKRSLLIFLK